MTHCARGHALIAEDSTVWVQSKGTRRRLLCCYGHSQFVPLPLSVEELQASRATWCETHRRPRPCSGCSKAGRAYREKTHEVEA